eukprot:CAMPEP_0119573826 /NCGR_PEP_ID=MMETSP1352-20130426/45318_1 /TAXON_ID=265584 /ORGANISM="Stauroneis constricta, Strain CCMP1120" /LENGTH=162 /DNA_ID=CAMNT_0007623517 /DNA_START=853 /DNA_END=1342 /DNA_ORIENTATION=+
MSLSEMREALERGSAEEPTNDDAADDSAADANDDNGDNDNSDAQRPKSRQPPEERGAGLKESRSSIVHLEGRKGSLTYSNSVGALKRAGSSGKEQQVYGSLLEGRCRRGPKALQYSIPSGQVMAMAMVTSGLAWRPRAHGSVCACAHMQTRSGARYGMVPTQ